MKAGVLRDFAAPLADHIAMALQHAFRASDEKRPEEVDVALDCGEVVQGDLDEILDAGVA